MVPFLVGWDDLHVGIAIAGADYSVVARIGFPGGLGRYPWAILIPQLLFVWASRQQIGASVFRVLEQP